MKFSFFKSAQAKSGKPDGTLSIEQLINHIKEGTWKKQVLIVRGRTDSKAYRLLKEKLPAFTGSAILLTREQSKAVEERLKEHSGIIFIDIDAKDNPRLRVKDLVDKECLAQFVSPGGKGIKMAYRCKKVQTAAEHRRVFDAVVKRLEAKGIKIKVDPVVKSIASLQFVSYDPEAYYNPKSKLVIQPLQPIKIQRTYVSEGNEQLKQLDEYIEALGKKDITAGYDDWLNVLFGIAFSFGELGRSRAHLICRNYAGYSEAEVNEKYDGCIESTQQADNPVTVSTVFALIIANIPVAKRKELGKKYNQTHAKGKADEAEEVTDVPDLAGFVRYGIWLFKKIIDKKTNSIVELQLARLNWNAFESLLRSLGLYRYQRMQGRDMYVQILDNIVYTVDTSDILRIVTDKIEGEGSYNFFYDTIEYHFAWEELVLKWRDMRANGQLGNQIAASLTHWLPNLLEDNRDTAYIPYRNGVLQVNAKGSTLLPYAEIKQQIWKDQILPRDFKMVAKPGMYQEFYRNVFGTGATKKAQLSSESYLRAVWYYGYVLHALKDEALARAWVLYDRETGNNGRTGKTIAAKAAGYLRPMEIIDGQRVDLTDRFAFQTVNPWTKIILIDDVRKGESLNSIFAIITGEMTADKKNIAPVKIMAKVVLTSNWIMAAEGSSESGRQFINQAGTFYKDYSTAHGDTATPIVDYHGKTFFSGWDARDWGAFDTFSAQCLQTYFKDKAPAGTVVGNSRMLRFIQLNEEEIFFSLCIALINNAYERDGILRVSMPAMTEAIREHNEGMVGKKAGIIIRQFFQAIQGDYKGIANEMGPSGNKRNVYLLGRLLTQLDFGNYAERLGRGIGIATKKGERALKTKKKQVK